VGVELALGANPASHLAAHHAAFSTSANCKVQLILRCCGRQGCEVCPQRSCGAWSGMPCAYFEGKNREMKAKKDGEGLLFRMMSLGVCGVSKEAGKKNKYLSV